MSMGRFRNHCHQMMIEALRQVGRAMERDYQLSSKNSHFYIFLTLYCFIPLSISSNLIFALVTIGVQTVNDGWSRGRWMRGDI